MEGKTTARALAPRAAAFVAALPADDPVAVANRLIDEAVALQDAGRFADADALLDRADALLA